MKSYLLFLSWLLADQDDFITRLEADTHTTLKRVEPGRRLEILGGANSKLGTREAFAPDVLHEMIFSKTNPDGLEPIWQRASHLITSQGELLRTEDLNINFIFHDPGSGDLFEPLYRNLPYVLLYAIQVALECFACILRYNELTVSHPIIWSFTQTNACQLRRDVSASNSDVTHAVSHPRFRSTGSWLVPRFGSTGSTERTRLWTARSC